MANDFSWVDEMMKKHQTGLELETPESQKPVTDNGMDPNRDLEIIGYIAGRKNCLAFHIPSDDIKKVYIPMVKEYLKGGGAMKVNKVKLTKEGTKQVESTEILLDLKPSALKLRSLNFDAFMELKSRKTFKVNMSELKPEFLMMRNKFAKAMIDKGLGAYDSPTDGKNFTAEVDEFTAATSEDGVMSAIKPAKLAVLMFTLEMDPIKVVKDSTTIGIIAPQMKKTKYKGNETYVPDILVYTYPGREKVSQVGHLSPYYVVNRSYEGDSVVPEKIDNLETFNKLFPDQDANALRLRLPNKKVEKNEPTTAEQQEIPYEEMKMASRIGLNPKMLQDLRRKGSRGNQVSMKDIKDSIEVSKSLFRKMEQMKR